MKLDILIPVLIYEIAVIFGVGFYLMKKGHHGSEGDFALGGRSHGVGITGVSGAKAVLGTAHILGVFELTYQLGAVALWFSLAHVVTLVLASYGTGRWVRRLHVTTVPESMRGMYGQKISLMIGAVMAGVTWGILTLECQGFGIVVKAMTGLPIAVAAIIGGVLGIFYVNLAGMKEVGIVNMFNAFVMYIGLVAATFVVGAKLTGGFDGARERILAMPEGQEFLSVMGNPQTRINFALAIVISVTTCQAINQMLMQMYMAAKDEKTVRHSVWISAPVNGLFGAFAVAIGLAARVEPGYENLSPKDAAVTMVIDMLPGLLGALLLAALLAAILATFAMTSLTSATIYSMDIYKGLFKPDATEKEISRNIRLWVMILGTLGLALSTFLPPILGAINWLFAWLTPVFLLFIFGLFWKRDTRVAGWTLGVSWAVNMLWTFSALPKLFPESIGSLPNVYVTLVFALLILIPGNLMVQGEGPYLRQQEALDADGAAVPAGAAD